MSKTNTTAATRRNTSGASRASGASTGPGGLPKVRPSGVMLGDTMLMTGSNFGRDKGTVPAPPEYELPDTELTRQEGCIHASIVRLDAMLVELAGRLKHVSEPEVVDAGFCEVSAGAVGAEADVMPRSVLGQMLRSRAAHIDRMASNVSGIIQRLRA